MDHAVNHALATWTRNDDDGNEDADDDTDDDADDDGGDDAYTC